VCVCVCVCVCDMQKQFHIRRLTGDLKLEWTFVCPEYGVLRGGKLKQVDYFLFNEITDL
jgi:hypothetical protein